MSTGKKILLLAAFFLIISCQEDNDENNISNPEDEEITIDDDENNTDDKVIRIDSGHRLKSYKKTTRNSGLADGIVTFIYTYDQNKNVTSIKRTFLDSEEIIYSLRYADNYYSAPGEEGTETTIQANSSIKTLPNYTYIIKNNNKRVVDQSTRETTFDDITNTFDFILHHENGLLKAYTKYDAGDPYLSKNYTSYTIIGDKYLDMYITTCPRQTGFSNDQTGFYDGNCTEGLAILNYNYGALKGYIPSKRLIGELTGANTALTPYDTHVNEIFLSDLPISQIGNNQVISYIHYEFDSSNRVTKRYTSSSSTPVNIQDGTIEEFIWE